MRASVAGSDLLRMHLLQSFLRHGVLSPTMVSMLLLPSLRNGVLSPTMIIDAIEQVGGIYVLTADHGNAEDMVKRNKKGEPLLDKNGKIQILTSHTLEPVPVAIGGPGLAPGVRFRKDVPEGGLANVAARNSHQFARF